MENKKKVKSVAAVYILLIIAVLSVITMIIALSLSEKDEKGEFIPPEFDAAAVKGIPDVPENLGYSSPYQDGMAYRFSVCGYMTMDSNKAVVYFTNAAENDVYLKLRLLDVNGKTLGETGLLKPGEYVKDVELNVIPSAGTGIILKIMSYEPDTYMSAGSVTLKTTIGE